MLKTIAIEAAGATVVFGLQYGGTVEQRAHRSLPSTRSIHRPAGPAEVAYGGTNSGLRWEDYAQTAIDPSDDCTIWYVGDYIKKNAESYSSRIGAFRLPGCSDRR